MKKSLNIHNLRCNGTEDINFEELLEEDLKDIEEFLNSYTVARVEEEKIDITIEKLKEYMPKPKVEIRQITILDKVKDSMNLVKFQFNLMNKSYFIASLLLILLGSITTIRLNLSIYLSASMIAPIPILLGIFELIKGRDENVWELELSYKYSLREIILSRIIIINLVAILTSITMGVVLNNIYNKTNLLEVVSIWLIPVFLVATISLIITSLYRNINSITLCISVWILGAMAIGIYERIADISEINIFIVLCLSIVSLSMAIKLFYKKSINSIDLKIFDF